MGKLTTLEGDDFLGWSLTKAAKKTVKATKSVAKAVAVAPLTITKATLQAPNQVAKLVNAPKAVVNATKAVTAAPLSLLKTAEKATNTVVNIAAKPVEVVAPALTKSVTKVAEVAVRNPLTTAAATAGLSILPTLLTKTGRQNLIGKKSVLQQSVRFAERHPYMTAIPTGGASLVAAITTKRGRQALSGKRPGYRSAPGLTGVEKDEFLSLKNKSEKTPQDVTRIAELEAKGKEKVAADKVAAEQAAAKTESSSSFAPNSSSGGGGGGGSYLAPETSAVTEDTASPLGPLLIAGGLAALALL